MGSKNKLKRFAENARFKNVLQPTREDVLSGKFRSADLWKAHFNNENPLVLELGCGKGEYTVGLANRDPDRNYIGIDIKGARLWRGAKQALENKLDNVAFLRTQIELIDSIFQQGEIDEIWITFPDPQIKYKRTKHRLINLGFFEKYKTILKPQGVINLKTDSEFLHGYSLGLLHGANGEILYTNHNIYKNEGSPPEALEIQTFYENQYLESGKPITFIKFRLP